MYTPGCTRMLPESCCLPALIVANFQPIGANFRQKGQKLDFLWWSLVFSRENRRPKRVKFKIYLNLRIAGAFVLALSLWRWWCPLVQAFEGAGPEECLRWSSGRVFRLFVRFVALPLVRCLQIWLYFAFLGRFGGVSLVPCVFAWLGCFALIVGLLCA